MVQVQIRIRIPDDKSIQMLYEILPREDASEEEMDIAHSLEKSFEAINARAARISGMKLKKVSIKERETKGAK